MKKVIDLCGKWELSAISPENETFHIAGNVPGSALSDILDSDIGKGVDIFYRDNAKDFQKYENYDYIYEKTFTVESLPVSPFLVFDRLDTYCDIYLNDKFLCHRENGNIRHVIDVKGSLTEGENRLVLYFSSPISSVKGKKLMTGAFTVERMRTRRMQCTYGWDWTYRFVTCGISGDAYIAEKRTDTEIESLYVYTKNITECVAELCIDVDISVFSGGNILDFEITSPDGELVYSHSCFVKENFLRLYATIPDAQLWYPLGYGDQPIYTLTVYIKGQAAASETFGIRTVQILEIPDKPGSPEYEKCKKLKETDFSRHYDKNEKHSGFILTVNGTRILARGANWVPCEPICRGNTDAKVSETLRLAKECGVNMIRIWGGGAFETEHFYDECSRLGIMVTQDFLMACGKYPENEDWFIDQLNQEADYAVHLIRNKPCLMWWTGDNENAVEGCDTDENYSGRNSAYNGIAPILHKYDSARRFLPSSPYGGVNYASNTVGTTHNTQFLGSFLNYILNSDAADYKEYMKTYNARFIAEEPSLGACELPTLEKFMTHEDVFGDDLSMWLFHTQTNPGLPKQVFDYLSIFAEKVLGTYKDAKDRFFKLRYMQYEWLRVSLERTRREKWFCSGIIYWMLNDCWPAASGWAFIDYYGKPKSSFYSFRRAAKNLVVSLDREDGKTSAYICADGKELPEKAELSVYAIRDGGMTAEKLFCGEYDIKSGISFAAKEFTAADIPGSSVIIAELTDKNGVLFDRSFIKDGTLPLEEASSGVCIVSKDENAVTLTAKRYIHAVSLSSSCGAVFRDNYFSLLPGETRTVGFTGAGGNITAEAYTIKEL